MNRTKWLSVVLLLCLCLLLCACGAAKPGLTPEDVARKLGMVPLESGTSFETESVSIPLESRADGCLDGYRSMELVAGMVGGQTEVVYLFHYASHESVVEAMTLNYSASNVTIAYGDREVLLYFGDHPDLLRGMKQAYTIKQQKGL